MRQKVIANSGRLDQLSLKDLDPLINGLNRALGRTTNQAFQPEYESAKAYGDVYALHQLWHQLGFAQVIRKALRSSRRSIDTEAVVRALGRSPFCRATSGGGA